MSKPSLEMLLAQCRKPEGPPVIEAESLTASEANLLVSYLAAVNIHARAIDGAAIGGKADILAALATAFNFPSHFGHNWDALIDSWSDLSWLPASGYVCILLHADAFRAAHPRIHETLLEVCTDVAERWHEYDPRTVFKLLRAAKA